MQLMNHSKLKKIRGQKSMPRLENFHGGFGSESLKECIELLNATISNSPATLHSGVGYPESTVPVHISEPSYQHALAFLKKKKNDNFMNKNFVSIPTASRIAHISRIFGAALCYR